MPRRLRLLSSWRFTRCGARPWSSPSSIGLNVFVESTTSSRTSEPFVRSQSPMKDSLRPPPYASAVSKVVIPASQAASMIAKASSRLSPPPKSSGADPMPPKLPQPRITFETRMPVPPRYARSMSATVLDVKAARSRFSSLQGGFAFLDAPGGSQVPDEVGDAIARALREASANLGAPYETGKRVEAILNDARSDAGRFLRCSADDGILGTNRKHP